MRTVFHFVGNESPPYVYLFAVLFKIQNNRNAFSRCSREMFLAKQTEQYEFLTQCRCSNELGIASSTQAVKDLPTHQGSAASCYAFLLLSGSRLVSEHQKLLELCTSFFNCGHSASWKFCWRAVKSDQREQREMPDLGCCTVWALGSSQLHLPAQVECRCTPPAAWTGVPSWYLKRGASENWA